MVITYRTLWSMNRTAFFLLVFSYLFFHSVFAKRRMQRRYLHVATWIIKFFWSRPESAFFWCFLGIPGFCDEIQPIWIQRNARLSYKKHPRLRLWLSAPPVHPMQGTVSATLLYLQQHLVGTCKSFLKKKKKSFICLLFSLAFISVAFMCAFFPCWSFLNDSDFSTAYMQTIAGAYHLQADRRTGKWSFQWEGL